MAKQVEAAYENGLPLWNRDELYKEVWATPIQTLANKYGISDVGLAKVCRKLAIPLPGRGYWARTEAGQKVKQIPLPPLKEQIILRKPTRRPVSPNPSDFATQPELAQIDQLEQALGEMPPKHGNLSHPLVLQARSLLTGLKVGGGAILRTTQPGLDIRVSKDTLDRALWVMADLIRVIEDAGFRVSVEVGERTRTVANIHGQEINFGLAEKPSGKLVIEVRSGWGLIKKRWKEGKSKRLEEQLPKVVAGFIRIALAERAKREKRASEEWERQQEAEERTRLEDSIKAEQSKVRALEHAAAMWSRAERIRSFISAARDEAVQNGHPVNAGSTFGEWIVWAQEQADRLDPLKEGLVFHHRPRSGS